MSDPEKNEDAPNSPGTSCNGRGAKNLRQLRRSRLESRLGELRVLLDSSSDARKDSEAWQCAQSSLEGAEAASREGKLQIAWVQCHQAKRSYLASLEPQAIRLYKQVLRREADEKLQNWRRLAILDLLDAGEVNGAEDSTVCEKIRLAQQLLDEHFDNMYFKLQALGLRLRRLPLILGLTIITILGLSWVWRTDETGVLFFDFQHTVLVLVTGALGALLSHTLSALHPGSRIPEFVADSTRWMVVPFVGALSAVGLILVIESGLLPVATKPGSSLLGWALVGGFSDQLLKRALSKIEKSVEK